MYSSFLDLLMSVVLWESLFSHETVPRGVFKKVKRCTMFQNHRKKSHSTLRKRVLPDRSLLIGQKLVENAKIEKNQVRHFEWFSNNVRWQSFWIQSHHQQHHPFLLFIWRNIDTGFWSNIFYFAFQRPKKMIQERSNV